jgi:hypothetical protein
MNQIVDQLQIQCITNDHENNFIGKINIRNLKCNIPIFQRQQNLDKIQTIIEYQREYYHKYGRFEFLGIISIAYMNDSSSMNKIYILDGQHRLCAMKKLLEEGYPDFSIYIQIVPVVTLDEMREKFRILNSHVEVPEYVLLGSLEQKRMLEELGEYIRNRYPNYLSNSQRPRIPHIYLETFLDNIFKNDNFDQNIFERYQITQIHHLIHYMESWNSELLNRFQHSKREYYELITKKIKPKKIINNGVAVVATASISNFFSLGLDKTDQWLSNHAMNIESYQSYMIPMEFIKSIQPYLHKNRGSAMTVAEAEIALEEGIKWISMSRNNMDISESDPEIMDIESIENINSGINPAQNLNLNLNLNINKKRKPIKKPVRQALWTQYYQNSIEGLCYVCQTNKITCFNFEVGHVIAVANGGTDHIKNLRPICKSCNCSMGTQNLESYKMQYFSN